MEDKEVILHKYLEDMKNGDMTCFDDFYLLTRDYVFYTICKIINDFAYSEDILQETYVYFLSHLSSINTKSSIQGYLLLTAKHLSIDHIRKKKKEVSLDDIAYMFHYDQHEYSDLLDKIKSVLTKEELNIFILRNIDEFNFKDIAEFLNKPLGTILWKYNQILKRLRKELKDYAR